MKGPQFLIYIRPLIEVLKNNGGSGITSDIIDQVIEYMNIPEERLAETISSGASRVRNQIQWARMYLVCPHQDLRNFAKGYLPKLGFMMFKLLVEVGTKELMEQA